MNPEEIAASMEDDEIRITLPEVSLKKKWHQQEKTWQEKQISEVYNKYINGSYDPSPYITTPYSIAVPHIFNRSPIRPNTNKQIIAEKLAAQISINALIGKENTQKPIEPKTKTKPKRQIDLD